MDSHDQELFKGLSLLTDQEVNRVRAHIAAGLQMRLQWGWELGGNAPACFGCLVGTAMTEEASLRSRAVRHLGNYVFPNWAAVVENMPRAKYSPDLPAADYYGKRLEPSTLSRLAALLDQEWARRHPQAQAPRIAIGNSQVEEIKELV